MARYESYGTELLSACCSPRSSGERPDEVVAPEGPVGRALESCRRYLLAVASRELDRELRPKGDASDLVQDTMAVAFRDRDQFRGLTPVQLRQWLRGILRHQLKHFRRRYRAAACRAVGREVALERLAATSAGPADEAERRELCAALDAAIRRLPATLRQVVWLRLNTDESFRDIGARLDRSAEAARKLWERAVLRLRAQLVRQAG